MAQFTNQARLAYNNTTVNSNVAVGELVEAITATKNSLEESYDNSTTITYTVSLVNTSTNALNGLTLTDNLGAYTFLTNTLYPLTYKPDSTQIIINGVVTATPTVTAGPPLTISGINLPANGTAVIIYQATVNDLAPVPVGSTITNTVTVTGSGLVNPVVASHTIPVSNEPLLNITKSISPVPVTENSTITYTLLIENRGNTAADAGAALVITDTFDPILSNIAVSLNGTPLPSTSYTYDSASGLFTTTAGSITVPAATSSQNPVTGEWTIVPGQTTLTITGTI